MIGRSYFGGLVEPPPMTRWRVVLVVALVAVAAGAVLATASAADDGTAGDGANESTTSVDRSVWNRTYLGYPADDGGNRSFYGVTETSDGLLFVGAGRDSIGAVDGEVRALVVETEMDGSLVWERPVMPAGTHHRVFHDGLKFGPQTYVFGGTINAPSRFETGTYWLEDSDRNVHTWQIRSGDGAFFDLLRVQDGVVAVGSRVVIQIGTGGTVAWRHAPADVGVYRAGARANDGFVLAGWTVSRQTGGFGDAARIRGIDGNGETEWTRTFDLAAGYEATASHFYAATRSPVGFVFGGTRTTADGRHGWIVVTNETGAVEWTHSLPAATRVLGVAAGPDGIVAVGQTDNETGVVWRFDRNGTLRSRARYGHVLRDVTRTDRATYVAAGARPATNRDPFAVALDYVSPNATLQVTSDRARAGRTAVRVVANGSTDNTAIAAYRWDFDGDGRVDRTTSNPTVVHTFTETGTVRPAVTVVDAAGNTARANASAIEVVDRTPPTVGLADPANGLVATSGPTLLDANASTDNGRIQHYQWDFDGDGSVDRTTAGPTTSYRFEHPNHTYSIGVGAVDAAGNRNLTTVAIETRPNDRPNVTVDVDAWRVGDGARARLAATVRDAVGTTTVRWRLPNGSVRTGPTVAFGFDRSPVSVTVTVADEYGARRSRAIDVWTRTARAERTPIGRIGTLMDAFGHVIGSLADLLS